VPAVDTLGTLGRWAFAELTEMYLIESDFAAKVESAFNEMIERAGGARSAITT
jgi:type III restriction enzyme